MSHKLDTKLFTAIVIGLAVAVVAPIASAQSTPQGKVTVPAWLARIQYPGTSSKPTVYMAGSIPIPASLARTQYPGTSSEPTVLMNVNGSRQATVQTTQNGQIAIPAWLARIQYPGTSSEPTVVVSTPLTTSSASGFDWGSFAIGIAAAAGVALIGAAGLLAMRRRHPLARV